MSHIQRHEILSQVRSAISETFYLPENVIVSTSNLSEYTELDSLDMVELGIRLEEIFGVEIPNDAMAGFHTVSDVVAWLADRVPEYA